MRVYGPIIDPLPEEMVMSNFLDFLLNISFFSAKIYHYSLSLPLTYDPFLSPLMLLSLLHR